MKKKIILLFAAAAMMTSTAAAAANDSGIIGGADGLTEIYIPDNTPIFDIPYTAEIPEQYSIDYGIKGVANIYYNSQFLDPTIIIKSRTMFPFRNFLETIGAAVTYDEKTKTVTAARGETEIYFTLDSDTIHIKNDLGEKNITMDVTPIVIEGKTYVPIRFLGEAFAMQVDWNAFERTVLIVDFEKYYDELWANCTNIMKIAELGLLQPESSALSGKAALGFHLDSPSYVKGNIERETLDIELSMESNGTQVSMDSDTTSTINFSFSNHLGENIEIKDASLDLIMKDDVLYFKTNIGEQLTDIPPEAAKFLQGDWFKISLEDFITLTGSSMDIEYMRGLLNDSQNPRAMLEHQIKTRGSKLYGRYSVDRVTDTVKLLTKIDSYINVAETGEDDYMITLNMDNDDLMDHIISRSDMSEDEIATLRGDFNNIVFNANVEKAITDKIVTAQKLTFEYSAKDEDASMSFTINSDSAVNPAAEVEDIEIPDNAVDILEKIYGI